MSKSLLVLSLLLAATLSLTDKEILQTTLNGAFEQNKLPDPTTIMPCVDDATAHKIVVFIGQVLEKAAKGSVSDIIGLVQMIKDFGDQIPQSVKDCLNGNEEFKALGKKYGIDDDTNSTEIEKKVITYVTLHYLTVHKWFGDLNTQWKGGKYYDVGYNAAKDAHEILGYHSMPAITDQEILQQALNGAFEENKLPDPTTIVQCGNETTNHNTVVFIGKLMNDLAKAGPTDYEKIAAQVKNYSDSVPEETKQCMANNQELKNLGLKYGIDDQTDPDVIEKKIAAYVALHYLTVHKWMGDLNNLWNVAHDYYKFGNDAATHAHTVLGITPEDIKRIREIQ